MRQRPSNFEDVDAALFAWFSNASANNLPISGEVLRNKA
jgi:hypothetical protein